jgi:hypothetical protein
MRQCAFCTSTKLSKEHVWSNWINKCIPPVTFTIRKSLKEGNFKEWTMEGLRQTAFAVCKECNNGWMSLLEAREAKPALSGLIRYGAPLSILPNAVRSIAIFAFKTAVIANSIGDLRDTPYFCTADRYHFAKTLEIPHGVQVWLFAVDAPGRVTGKLNSHFGRLPIATKFGFDLYICTFVIGFVGIQVVASRWANPHVAAFIPRFPGVRESRNWNGTTVPIWPSNGGAIVWPPERPIRLDQVPEFCNRWKDARLPEWIVKD